ncbi:ATP-binding protein [Sphingomonas sp. LM7]|uniref:ATP-binding protein n=1 Tax=Sphingomonas sp. LM7 TaxID=1938607 RepID=UPI000983CD82|nr:ATP-binding protein [Sphingomonas sp. LM7]AQR75723.1 hypothetical protein BXU08_06755 [Sphingomonas sp. LM7]
MAALMRATDWSKTTLGPVEGWPEALKVAIRILLTSRFDMWLGWGDEVAFLYNDAYRPTLGSKHPASLAKPTRELWAEIWPDIEPLIRQVYEQGEATWSEALLLLLERNGYAEETYHTFSYSPVFDDAGTVGGLLCAVVEETDRVITGRRLESLRLLATELTTAETPPEVFAAAHAALASNPQDAPFSVTWLFDGDTAQIIGRTGLEGPHPALPETMRLDAEARWPLRNGGVVSLAGVSALPTGPWKKPPEHAAILPLEGQGADDARGAILVGLNPHLLPDDDYLGYLGLLAGQIGSGLHSAESHHAARRRAESLAEAARLRAEAAEALRELNVKLASEVVARTGERDRLWSLAEDLLARADYDGNLLAVNPAWTKLLGWSEQKLLTDPYADIIHPENVDTVLAALQEMGRTGEPTRFENRILSSEGVWTPVGWTVSPEPGGVHFIAVGRDLTEDKAREQELLGVQEALRQSQKMEAVGQLTGGIAHDFNNLLAGIAGNLELLELRLGQGRTVGLDRYITSAQGAARRAAALTQRLLAFSRRQTLDPRAVDANALVGGMEDLIRRTVGPSIEVEVVGAGGLWLTRVDPSQLENALLNLAINARDAMSGNGRLTIETANKWLDDRAAKERELPPGQYISLCVTDTGTGMTPDVIAQAFDPFFTTKPLGQGTGLGLSMIHGFVRQSGGQVRIYSEIGDGTTMCLYLPRFIGELDSPDDAHHPLNTSEGHGETVLVIDDEAPVRALIVEVLEEAGYSVIEAIDGATGLEVLRSQRRIDLLITDVGLPGGLNGRQVADAARVTRPDLKVLFITGYAENAAVGNGLLAPGMEVITKPFAVSAMGNKVRDMLDR